MVHPPSTRGSGAAIRSGSEGCVAWTAGERGGVVHTLYLPPAPASDGQSSLAGERRPSRNHAPPWCRPHRPACLRARQTVGDAPVPASPVCPPVATPKRPLVHQHRAGGRVQEAQRWPRGNLRGAGADRCRGCPTGAGPYAVSITTHNPPNRPPRTTSPGHLLFSAKAAALEAQGAGGREQKEP